MYMKRQVQCDEEKKIELADYRQCTGCEACCNICPTDCLEMKNDGEGFLFPVRDDARCIRCHRCERVCPILYPIPTHSESTKAYASMSKHTSMRLESSSGGIFSEISGQILQGEGLVYGAAYASDFSVRHIAIRQKNDLSLLRGAKYAQSRIFYAYREAENALKRDMPVLFSGTPCQIAGFKKYLNGDYDNLLTIDFVCHGIPSPFVWEKYLSYQRTKDMAGTNNSLVAVNLRSKRTGWSRYGYSTSFSYSDGKEVSCLNNQNLFMNLFVNDYINRESCASCPFKGYTRVSDITLGDFWGIWNIDPEFDDNKGTSLVLIHTNKGMKMFREIEPDIDYKVVSLEDASRENTSLLKPSAMKKNRPEILKLCLQGNFLEAQKIMQNGNTKQSFLMSTLLKRLKKRSRN